MRYLIGVLALCGALAAEPPTAIALRHARVVTGEGPVLERGTVLLRDGTIEAVGQELELPADAWVIEGQGLTVYPGLTDGLVVMDAPAAPGGGGGARAAPAPAGRQAVSRGPEDRPSTHSWRRAADMLAPEDRRIEEARNAGFTSAVFYPGSGIFAGQGAVVNLAGDKRRMVVQSPAGQYVTLAFRGPGSTPGFPASLLGVMAYIRQIYLDAAHYRERRAAWEQGVAGVARPDYDRALEGLLESPRVLLPARSRVEVERMAAFAKELGVAAVLYGAEGAYAATPRLAEAGFPVLVSLKWPERARDQDPEERESLRVLEARERASSTPAALAKAGVRFAFYSGGIPPREVRKAVKRAIDAGLPEEAAVRALTLAPAEIYGLERRMGSIAKGKIANLVVTDGPLFAEKTGIRYVFIDGVKFEPPREAPPEGRRAATGGAR